jgi:hypothetical protein
MPYTINLAVEFALETCCNCGMQYAVPIDWQKQRVEKKDSFYCPNGHSQHYLGETEATELRRELEAKERSEKWLQERLASAREERDTIERRLRASKGQNTKLRKRNAAGVCLCCNRTFQNLHQHMTTKHPDYTREVMKGGTVEGRDE